MILDGKTPANSLVQPGDIVQIAGVYKRRTFWQWLTRRSKQLQSFKIGAVNESTIHYAPGS
jgi:hypothetical protein